MPSKKLIRERISKTEEQSLSEADISMLTAKRDKQLLFLLTSYLPLAAIVLYIFINGITVITRDKPLINELEFTDEKEERFRLVVPYVCGFFFLLLTAFFANYYIKTLAPLIKDLKKKKKLLLHFIPEKTEMGVFNKYYLSTPVVAKQQIQIQREDFYSIVTGDSLIMETLPHSATILRFTYNEKEIKVP